MARYLFQGQRDSNGQLGPTLQKLFDRQQAKSAMETAITPLKYGVEAVLPATRPLVAAQALLHTPDAEASWAGILSKTANLDALKRAKTLLRQGVSPEDVWKQTGWGKAPEGKWMYEISDDRMRLRPDFNNLPKDPSRFNSRRITDMGLGAIFEHPELKAAYPEMFRNTRVTELHKKPDMFAHMAPSATWRPGFSGTKYWPSTPNEVEISASTPEQVLSNLVHEVGSHGTAQYEKFSRGTNQARMESLLNNDRGVRMDKIRRVLGDNPATDAYPAYLNNFGEANARLAESRINLNPQQRLEQYPWEPDYFKQMTGSDLTKLHGYE